MKKHPSTDLVLLKHHLRALRLPSFLSHAERLARESAKENIDHLGFLLRLCESELSDREHRATQRRIQAARFPSLKTLEEFDFAAQPGLNRVLISELMRCEFVDRRESVILLGNSGTGKTHLATALALSACQRGKRVRFWRVMELITQLLEAREEKQLTRLRSQLLRLDLLVLDELGYVPASKSGAELLFDVISTCYEKTSVMVTTNLPFEQWTEVLGSDRLVGATLDRLTHRCHLLEATGPSYRLRDAQRRQAGGSKSRSKGPEPAESADSNASDPTAEGSSEPSDA